jgi:hypothetical protein
VKRSRNHGFLRSESGTALTEGLLVFPLMVLAVSVCFEFGFMMHQWNQAAKAMQLGVRKLVVSEPILAGGTLGGIDAEVATGGTGGQLIDADATVTVSCGGSAGPACDEDGLDRLIEGNVAGGNWWPGLRRFFPYIEDNQVRVTYELSGLGYYGRPNGAVVTVRMDVERAPFEGLVVAALLDLAGITFPPFTVTATSEDLQSCPGGCS